MEGESDICSMHKCEERGDSLSRAIDSTFESRNSYCPVEEGTVAKFLHKIWTAIRLGDVKTMKWIDTYERYYCRHFYEGSHMIIKFLHSGRGLSHT